MTIPTPTGVYAVFRIASGEHVDDLPAEQELPDWVFGYDAATDSWKLEHEYEYILVHPSGSTEWIPAMGPAPCWWTASTGLLPRVEMYARLRAWGDAMYGSDELPVYEHYPNEQPFGRQYEDRKS